MTATDPDFFDDLDDEGIHSEDSPSLESVCDDTDESEEDSPAEATSDEESIDTFTE